MTTCIIDTGVFLCLAFEDPGNQYCGRLLDKTFKADITTILSSIQLTELYTPFLRAKDREGLQRMKQEIIKLEPKIRDVDEDVAEKAAECRSTVQTPDGKLLALADSIILATSILEGVEIIYTTDADFGSIKGIKVEAPEMDLKDWVRRYGPKKSAKGKLK